MQNFEPIIRIIDDEKALLVMFDSASSEDITRMPRLIRVDLPAEQFFLKMEHAEATSTQAALNVYLTVKSGDNETAYLLATITSTKNDERCRKIYDAISSAFSHALQVYLNQKNQHISAEGLHEAVLPLRHTSANGVGKNNGVQHDLLVAPRSTSAWKSVAKSAAVAVVLIGVVGLFFIMLPSMGASGVADPIQAAVAENMVQDPASITAQVELTKETLRQMGLDPGAAGDLGCLAPR